MTQHEFSNVAKLWVDLANEVVLHYNLNKGIQLPMLTSLPTKSTFGYEMYKEGDRVARLFFANQETDTLQAREAHVHTAMRYVPAHQIAIFKVFFRQHFDFKKLLRKFTNRDVAKFKLSFDRMPYHGAIPLDDKFYEKNCPRYKELTEDEKVKFIDFCDDAHDRTYGKFEELYPNKDALNWIPRNSKVRRLGGMNRLDYEMMFISRLNAAIRNILSQRFPSFKHRHERVIHW